MQLDQVRSLQLALSPTKTIEELKQAIGEPGPVETAQIKISDYMEASLTGPGFEITPVTPARQLVSQTEDTVWKWDVKAVREGKQRLNLTLNVIIDTGGKERLRALRTFSKDIEIDVAFSYRVKLFVEDNWQWLWAAIVVPLAVWCWRRWSSKKVNSNE